jgi:hypothetical protein
MRWNIFENYKYLINAAMAFSASLQNVLTKSITNWGLSLGKSRISSKWLSNIPCNEQKNYPEYTKHFSILGKIWIDGYVEQLYISIN